MNSPNASPKAHSPKAHSPKGHSGSHSPKASSFAININEQLNNYNQPCVYNETHTCFAKNHSRDSDSVCYTNDQIRGGYCKSAGQTLNMISDFEKNLAPFAADLGNFVSSVVGGVIGGGGGVGGGGVGGGVGGGGGGGGW